VAEFAGADAVKQAFSFSHQNGAFMPDAAEKTGQSELAALCGFRRRNAKKPSCGAILRISATVHYKFCTGSLLR